MRNASAHLPSAPRLAIEAGFANEPWRRTDAPEKRVVCHGTAPSEEQYLKRTHDLAQLPWTLFGWTPYLWRLEKGSAGAEVRVDAVPVPGSVQTALRNAGLLPDWKVGLQSRACEWVEHRHWIFETSCPMFGWTTERPSC